MTIEINIYVEKVKRNKNQKVRKTAKQKIKNNNNP